MSTVHIPPDVPDNLAELHPLQQLYVRGYRAGMVDALAAAVSMALEKGNWQEALMACLLAAQKREKTGEGGAP